MRAANEGTGRDSWSDQNLWRLRAILAGKDPVFGRGDDENDDDVAVDE